MGNLKTKEELSTLFKEIQNNIKKKETYLQGKNDLLEFRNEMWEIYQHIFNNMNDDEYSLIPLKNEKTICYYLYHLNRIEDITSNTLILDKEQIFYSKNYQSLLSSPISTTGNELKREELVSFSKQINIKELKSYISEVFKSTNSLIMNMTYNDVKIAVSKERKEKLIKLNSVSRDENAFWLVDYWCNKNYLGLFLMPFSRHQFMHLEACLRIIDKIRK